jgi:hypothetical protein
MAEQDRRQAYIDSLLKDMPGETRAEKVRNLKKQPEKTGTVFTRMSDPKYNVIETMDAQGNPPKRAPAKPPSLRGSGSGGKGSAGGGGMNPTDIEKVPGKRQLKMKSGGSVKSSASKRADGCAIRGKTKGKMK